MRRFQKIIHFLKLTALLVILLIVSSPGRTSSIFQKEARLLFTARITNLGTAHTVFFFELNAAFYFKNH